MFFVGGNLPGILALVGLLKIHIRQKERFVLNASAEKTTEVNADVEQNEINNKTEKVEVQEENKVQNATEKQAERLAKLEKLNAEGALTEEEYKHLKDTIMKK